MNLKKKIRRGWSSSTILWWIEAYLFDSDSLNKHQERASEREDEIGMCPRDSVPVDCFVNQHRLGQALTYQEGFGR